MARAFRRARSTLVAFTSLGCMLCTGFQVTRQPPPSSTDGLLQGRRGHEEKRSSAAHHQRASRFPPMRAFTTQDWSAAASMSSESASPMTSSTSIPYGDDLLAALPPSDTVPSGNPYNNVTGNSGVPSLEAPSLVVAAAAAADVLRPGAPHPSTARRRLLLDEGAGKEASATFFDAKGGAGLSSRRQWFTQAAAALAAGGVVVGGALVRENEKQNQKLGGGTTTATGNGRISAPSSSTVGNHKKVPSTSSSASLSSSSASTKHLRPLNMTQIAKETSVSLSVECLTGTTTIDTTTFQKKQAVRLPSWFPASLVPPPKVVKDIPDSELLVAAILAGSTMDMLRTSVLYPVLTLKNRIQKDIKTHKFPPTNDNMLHLQRRLKVMQLNAQKHFEEGKLYRGIVPSLLKSAPATGVYYGTRDVMKRALHSSFLPHMSTVQISIIAALVADIYSLMVKTPADTLATRLQVAKVPTMAEIRAEAKGEEATEEAIQAEVDAQVGNWFTESLERLPAIILTDLPYLLSRIAINQSLLNGNSIDIGRYEIMAITTALLCAFLTTPFDVARTRILIDSDNDPTNGVDGGSGEGLVHTMEKIMSEGDGGVRNLFAGWLERTLYLGVGRAWIEPFQMVGYAILRDLILLEWFD